MSAGTASATRGPGMGRGPSAWWAESLRRERTLTLLAAFMVLAMVPTAIALGLDERTFRGLSVWAKPMKFMASLALFSATTAWFFDLLPTSRRRATPLRVLVWTIVVASLLEVGYISLQAGLGQASHYSRADSLHMALYPVMGLLALSLMLTQPLLAWQIVRHGRSDVAPAWRDAVVLGLVMTFVLGVGAAVPLSAAQPPAGAGTLLFGWHLGGGDLRPAHFIGSHAQQLVPLAGWLLWRVCSHRPSGARERAPGYAQGRARLSLALFAAAYTGLWLAALLRGIEGAQWTAMR